MKLTIDFSELEIASNEAGDIIISPEGEKNLILLLEAKDRVEKLYEDAKLLIEQKALEANPNFQAVIGKDVKVGYRYFGKKYEPVPGLEDKLPEELVKKVTRYEVESSAVENYEKENGVLPDGILARNRKKTITIKRTGEADEI